ncbi:MAG: TonB-dependent receptor [Burkholderiales bacterium]|nr:TonB-dependent receptor [Burkholderiales bacterium]
MSRRLNGLNPTAFAVAAAMCVVATVASAQQTVGSITGKLSKGDVVTATNKTINVSRQVTVGDAGDWTISSLPPGEYTVTVTKANGTKDTVLVQVSAGQGAFASFTGTQRVVVTGSALRTLDVSNPNPSFTLSKAEIDRTPVAQNVTAVTLLAPGTLQGDGRIGGTAVRSGNLASIGGASVAENAYYINGFNVTNINKGIAFNEVPFEATGQFQLLNGGYGAEYGRSLGGVISVTTKRGTDEWKGGASLSYEPKDLRGSSVYALRSAPGIYTLVERPGDRDKIEGNFYVGGPVIKDSLYVFGLIKAAKLKENVYGEFNQQNFNSDTPQYMLKVDWNLNKSNLFELTAFNDRVTEEVANFTAPAPYSGTRGAYTATDKYTTGGSNVIAKWTGFITDNFTLSALGGVGKYARSNNIASSGCPAVYDGRPPRGTLEYKGCWSESAGIAVDDPNASDERKALRVDGELVLGKHTLKAGVDYEKYTTVDGSIYSGGHYYRLFTLNPGQSISGTGFRNNTNAPIDYVRDRVFRNGGKFETINSAWYVEDTWQATKDLVVSAGLRGESFENLNDTGQTFIKVSNTLAPRAGLAWDLRGDGQSKFYSNLGRYYIPVYSNTNVRLSGAETFYTDYWAFTGTFANDGTAKPGLGAQLGNRVVTSDGEPKDPRSVVDTNLKPMYQDEFILGFQQALGNRWSVGAKWTNRQLRKGMDDVCEGALAAKWAQANGYTATQAAAIRSAIGGCFLYNPGGELVANVDLDGSGELKQVKIPASAMLLPKAKRKYDSLELLAERQWDGKWSAQASLVIAWSRGNTEGYVKSDNGQDDAGITQDFDHPGLMEGAEGWLPNDRRYTLKASGSYAVTDEWRLGASLVAQSGRPKNCFGNYNGTIVDDSPLYGAASFYCTNLNPRGSLGRMPWTRDLSVQLVYSPQWAKGLTAKLDVLNVFNERGVRGMDEVGELDAVGSVNPTYQRPTLGSLQRPRSVRLSVAYEF